ncbi:hypothetical protein H6G41_31325 [Tolypothrix sp. FACHB-123]|uniref:hypothetical protein n=1 Tax=Tolypothrix sp. FACHB-123 TaxID=2692868 RepID=UPI001681D060|nr:hypothetical protein [Tolypothrix sp. FACHB-123]MBD2359028.1 hypothetical protein [Tolypothrix sp. FACHB-123]
MSRATYVRRRSEKLRGGMRRRRDVTILQLTVRDGNGVAVITENQAGGKFFLRLPPQ